ncbi:MAG TPA: hypothetical protein PLR18_03385 [bacterium]|nr:hypothetical protein [bacterium]
MSLFRRTILFIFLLELLSLWTWIFPVFNVACFFIILLLVLALSLKNLSSGLLIAFGELIIGSHGYLFSLSLGQGANIISIRLGIFMVVMLSWAIHIMRFGGFINFWHQLKNFRFFKDYLFLAIILIWGFVWGLIRGNDFGNVFLDFNNWLFFLYLLPLVSVTQDDKFWRALKSVSLACLVWLIFKTLLFFYVFGHQFIWALPEFYRWVRDTKIGEITQFKGNFYRIFLQSQIYCLLAFFIFLPYVKNLFLKYYSFILAGCFSVVIISFSRSFWVGFALGLFISLCLLVYGLGFYAINLKTGLKKISSYLLNLLVVGGLSLVLIFTVVYAPPKVDTNLVASLGQRATEMEAAGSSRLNMLKPLLLSIVNHPVIGSGFGTTVTYLSVDPRVVPATAGGTGEFTTYAFEWSYLDLILKIGLFGFFVYLLLIYKLLRALWQQITFQLNANSQNSESVISNFPLGLFLALIVLLAVNMFTPYLNHPLGIGFILVASIFLDYNHKPNKEF